MCVERIESSYFNSEWENGGEIVTVDSTEPTVTSPTYMTPQARAPTAT